MLYVPSQHEILLRFHYYILCVVVYIDKGCCCWAIIWMIPALVYYYHSFLNIKHECQIYYIYMDTCTYCSRRRLTQNEIYDDEETILRSHSHIHCHTGYEYVYEWKTIDWRYHPYKDDGKFFVSSPFDNMTNQTEFRLKALLEFINFNETSQFINPKQINLTEYVLHDDMYNYFEELAKNADPDNILNMKTTQNIESTISMSTTDDKYDVYWCDNLHPAYSTYSSCSSWPYKYYSVGETDACYTTNKCSKFSWKSPTANWNLSKGFGWTSIACAILFGLALLYWLFAWCYDAICGYNQYNSIGTTRF